MEESTTTVLLLQTLLSCEAQSGGGEEGSDVTLRQEGEVLQALQRITGAARGTLARKHHPGGHIDISAWLRANQCHCGT